MEMMLAENIKRLRKENYLTQEQLAEALGITVGAVYKWENGRSTPDIGTLMELADLFHVSLDALTGFHMHNDGVKDLDEKILLLQSQKKYAEAISQAEKALLRYPNHFQIVLRAGFLYGHAGTELEENKYLYRCIELLERSIVLLSQNTDPSISEAGIKSSIAEYYIILGQTEKGIEILKKYNVNGMNNPRIAIAYTGTDILHVDRPILDIREAEPYLTGAYFDILTSSVLTMIAYANYYYAIKDYKSGREAYLYLATLLQNMKIHSNKVAYVDKITSLCYYGCAKISMYLGERDTVSYYLQQAYEKAAQYDTTPLHGLENMRFCIGDTKTATAYDDLGQSALAAIETHILREDPQSLLWAVWQQLHGGTK